MTSALETTARKEWLVFDLPHDTMFAFGADHPVSGHRGWCDSDSCFRYDGRDVGPEMSFDFLELAGGVSSCSIFSSFSSISAVATA